MHQEKIWRTRWVTVFVILFFTAASVISTNQYRYGINDHSIIIPFLKSSLNPNLYPDDFLLAQKQFYYTYLWSFCTLFIEIFNISIPALFFIGYCASVFFIFLGVYLIAKTLFGKHEVGFLALFFLLFNIKTFAGSITIDYIFLTRIAGLPFLIFSVYFFLKEKYLFSSLLQGIGFLIHPMTAVYFITMQMVAFIFSLKFIGVKSFLKYLLILLVSCSPILLWKYQSAPASLNFVTAGQQWLELLRLRSPHHLFPFSWASEVWIRAGLVLLVFFICWKHKPQVYHHRVIKIFLIAIISMCLSGVLFTEFLPVSIILNLQLLRSFVFIYFIASIYYSNFFISEFLSNKNIFYKSAIIFMSMGIFYGASGWKYGLPAFFVFSIFLIFYRTFSKIELLLSKKFIFILLAVVMVTATGIYIKHPDFSINSKQDKAWIDMQVWAKENTNSEDKFIVPPYLEGFRVESERTVYCDWKDGTLMNFNPAFALEWLKRMEKLGYKKDSPLRDGFKNLNEENFISIAEEISVRKKSSSIFLITEKENPALKFPKLYENEKFIAYKIR